MRAVVITAAVLMMAGSWLAERYLDRRRQRAQALLLVLEGLRCGHECSEGHRYTSRCVLGPLGPAPEPCGATVLFGSQRLLCRLPEAHDGGHETGVVTWHETGVVTW